MCYDIPALTVTVKKKCQSQTVQAGVLPCCPGVGLEEGNMGQREPDANAIVCGCCNSTQISMGVWCRHWLSRGTGSHGHSVTENSIHSVNKYDSLIICILLHDQSVHLQNYCQVNAQQ